MAATVSNANLGSRHAGGGHLGGAVFHDTSVWLRAEAAALPAAAE